MKAKYLITMVLLLTLLSSAVFAHERHEKAADTSELLINTSFQIKIKRSFPTITGTKKIALTIDDGPTPKVTAAMLALLKELNIKATFFMLGKQAQENPRLVKMVSQDGHVIGNHTYSHKFFLYRKNKGDKEFSCRDDADVYQEIRKTHDILMPYISAQQKNLYFRPPGGGWCGRYAEVMNKDSELASYVGPLYWNMGGSMWYAKDGDATSPILDAGDEECWTTGVKPSVCLAGYRASVKRLKGGVMLVHDVHMKSVDMLRILLPELIEAGYEFVTLDEVSELDPGSY